MKEYIVAPAVRKNNEIRISRFCHAELISYDGFFKGAEQGFITSFNRFVDRKEALKIAKQNNEKLNKLCESDELYSEDLFIKEHELINRNKELEKEAKEAYGKGYFTRDEQAYQICEECDYRKECEENEKIIELMAIEMSEEDENFLYRNASDIIDYFKKKAKEEDK